METAYKRSRRVMPHSAAIAALSGIREVHAISIDFREPTRNAILRGEFPFAQARLALRPSTISPSLRCHRSPGPLWQGTCLNL